MDEHTLNGFCPSLSRPNNRDPHCPACHTMDLPENSDRAQVAALGSAGPAAGASVDLDQLAAEIVDRCEIGEAPYFTRERADLIVDVAARLAEQDEMPADEDWEFGLSYDSEAEIGRLLEIADEALAALPRWIPVEDGLPVGGTFLTKDVYGCYFLAWLDAGRWYAEGWSLPIAVTHYMDLPSPPEKPTPTRPDRAAPTEESQDVE